MNFQNIPYERITYEEIKTRYEQLYHELERVHDRDSCMDVLRHRYLLSDEMTAMDVCYIKYCINVNDPYFAAEQQYYNEIGPKLSELACGFNRRILDSACRPVFEEILGEQAIRIMETGLLCYDPRLNDLLLEESRLTEEYNKLAANATVEWDGRSIPRSQMNPYTQCADRETRKKASLAVAASWEAQCGPLERIYDDLVQNRHKQALALGYKNFVEMSYYRMSRIGYGAEEVGAFRDAVKKYLVPLYTKLEEHRRIRLGLDHLSYYDNTIAFPNGNPKLTGDTAACLAATEEMYTQLSPETADFIHHLMENNLYDVESRSGKCGGGFMMSLETYRSPFIFANFDGTSNDAYIMCHEGGHAFQYYLKRDDEIREHCWITSEIGESHAMSMELFTFPYMELFFGDRADDYRTRYLENTVWRILYQCEQDEFQQIVFEQPSLSCQQRNDLWAQLERDYFPSKDLSGNEHLEMGRGWQHIQHTFLWPFYAIDYGLAQVVALEYYQWMLQDTPSAWESYLTFCKKTGELNFTELAKASGLKSPFAPETIRSLAGWLEELLV